MKKEARPLFSWLILNKMFQRGKFIVLYGVNNLGKTTQAQQLVKHLILSGQNAEYLKYPVYESKMGRLINNYLRGGNFYYLSPREAQIIYSLDRTVYEKELTAKLDAGINVVAEDYVGTGLAWGIGNGVEETFLRYINSHLLREDLAILLDGERYHASAEKEHHNELDESLIRRVRSIHLRLGHELGWIKINANQTKEEVHESVWNVVSALFTPTS